MTPYNEHAVSRCPLFIELCCGSAAVTLRLIGGSHARPPISYMGSKNGYATSILNVLGLRSGQGADAVVLCDAGSWAKAWRLLTTPEGCRAVASVIRGWIGEDARALWDRLRAEPVPDGEAEAVGAWMCVDENAMHGGAWKKPPDGISSDANLSAAGLRACLAGPPQRNRWATVPLDALSWPPVQVIEGDVVGVEPRDVAKWMYLRGNEAMGGGFAAQTSGWRGERGDFGAKRPPASFLAEKVPWGSGSLPTLEGVPWPPTIVSNADVSTVEPGTLPEGTVCMIDPPYKGDGTKKITGYAHDLSRAAVVEVALEWAAAGASVAVCESVALPELLALGWYSVEITDCRVGQKRTFSRCKSEWLTLSRPPVWRPSKQADLFGPPQTTG